LLSPVPFPLAGTVEPIVVIPATDSVLSREGSTVTVDVVADAVPPDPMHVRV
jgi:hypothetical protein